MAKVRALAVQRHTCGQGVRLFHAYQCLASIGKESWGHEGCLAQTFLPRFSLFCPFVIFQIYFFFFIFLNKYIVFK